MQENLINIPADINRLITTASGGDAHSGKVTIERSQLMELLTIYISNNNRAVFDHAFAIGKQVSEHAQTHDVLRSQLPA